jgi:chromosome partitioning protein
MSTQIAFVNGKGGVGKTTACLMLALTLREIRREAVVIDKDPQKSATTFAESIGLRAVTESTGESPFVIVDTPPNMAHPDTLEAIRTADLVVLITTPSPADLSATAATAQLIQKLRKKPTVVLFNRVQASNRFSKTLEGVSAKLPFPTLPNILFQRTAYQVAELEGWRSLPQLARTELAQLALSIVSYLPQSEHIANVPQ